MFFNKLNLEVKVRNKLGTFTNKWKLNNTLMHILNVKWVKEELEKVNEKCFETQENDNMRY